MSYSDIKITQADINNNNVRSASDILIGNADDNKAVFDKLPEFIAGKHNDLVDALDEVSEHAQGDTEEIDRLSAEKVNVPKNGTELDFGEAGQMLTTKGNGQTQWEDAGQPTDEQTQNAINNWLDKHPEATTTVQDGSITYAKLHGSLKTYVTPEMFGAVGDGITDDTQAIQNAIDSGYYVIFLEKEYLISSSILIRKKYWNMDASNATIIYTGTGYAFDISETCNVDLNLGVINAVNGGCLYLHSDSVQNYVQYVNIQFSQFRANTNCILGHVQLAGWVNEIRLHDGRFIAGENGCQLFKDGATDTMNHWNFYNIGVEGVTNGFFFNNASDSRISDIVFVGCRYNESFEKLIKSIGLCQYFTFVGGGTVNPSVVDVSAESDLWRFIAPSLSKHESLIVQKGKVLTCGYSELLDGGFSLQSNEDLNYYTFPCNAYVGSGAVAQTLMNCPVNSSFKMRVFSASGLYYDGGIYNSLIQEISPNSGEEFFRRRVYNGGSSDWIFGAWHRYTADEVLSEVSTITHGNTVFSYRYNNKYCEWWLETNADAYNTQTQLGTLPNGCHPKKSIWESLSIWTNTAVTGSDRNALRITNTGQVQIIAPNAYQVGHGIFLL